MANGADKDAALRIAWDGGGAARAALEQTAAVEKREATVPELLVVAGEAAALKDGGDAAVKEAGVPGWRFLGRP